MNTTLHELHKCGLAIQAREFRTAFGAAFRRAEHAPVATIEAFWDQFVKAHAVIYRGGTERMAA